MPVFKVNNLNYTWITLLLASVPMLPKKVMYKCFRLSVCHRHCGFLIRRLNFHKFKYVNSFYVHRFIRNEIVVVVVDFCLPVERLNVKL